MGIMGCYPDKRAIENELGGKWEKVETINVDGSDVFIYDTDIDNVTPLNINGIMLVFDLTSSTNATLRITNRNNDNLLTTLINSSTAPYGIVRDVCKNGLHDTVVFRQSQLKSGIASNQTSINLLTTPFDNSYYAFALSVGTGIELTGTIDVYFLRGV